MGVVSEVSEALGSDTAQSISICFWTKLFSLCHLRLASRDFRGGWHGRISTRPLLSRWEAPCQVQAPLCSLLHQLGRSSEPSSRGSQFCSFVLSQL